MVTRAEVYSAIDSERDYQTRVWGTEGIDNPLTIGEFILNMEEQLNRARKMWADEPKPEVQTLEFVRKIAGLATNRMEQHGAPKRN